MGADKVEFEFVKTINSYLKKLKCSGKLTFWICPNAFVLMQTKNASLTELQQTQILNMSAAKLKI